GVQDVGERVVGGRLHGLGDALEGGAAHDVGVRASEKFELRRVVGLTVFGQVEAEPPKLGALVAADTVDRVVEHLRYQLPQDPPSMAMALAGASDAAPAQKSSMPRWPVDPRTYGSDSRCIKRSRLNPVEDQVPFGEVPAARRAQKHVREAAERLLVPV